MFPSFSEKCGASEAHTTCRTEWSQILQGSPEELPVQHQYEQESKSL